MAKAYIQLHGTKKEVAETLASLPHRASDCMVQPMMRIFPHMIEHLGIEIYSCIMSTDRNSTVEKHLAVLKEKGQKYPKMLWEIGDDRYNPLGDDYTNYKHHNPDAPGPFGALCIAYGKSYWGKEIKVS